MPSSTSSRARPSPPTPCVSLPLSSLAPSSFLRLTPPLARPQVIGRDGFLLGAESTYSVPTGAITRYALGLGYAAPSYTVTVHGLANLSVFSASYYHKVSKDVEAGAKAIYDTKVQGSQVGLEVGTKAYLDVRPPLPPHPSCARFVLLTLYVSSPCRTLPSSRSVELVSLVALLDAH